MFYFLISLVICKDFCFYNTDSSLCSQNPGAELISYAEFQKFETAMKEENQTVNILVAESMPNNVKIDISARQTNATLTRCEKLEYFPDVYVSSQTFTSIATFRIIGATIHADSNVISGKHLQIYQTKFNTAGPVQIDAYKLDSDLFVFSQIKEINVTARMYVFANSSEKIEKLENYVRVNPKPTTSVYINFINSSAEFNILGDYFIISANELKWKFYFIITQRLNRPVNLFANDGSTLSMSCFARGPHYYNFRFYVQLNNSNLVIPKSLWPILGPLDDAIVGIRREGPAKIYLGMYDAPFKITYSKHPLEIIATEPAVGISFALYVIENEITVSSQVENSTFIVRELKTGSKDILINNTTPNHQMFINKITTKENISLNFKGVGYYCIDKFPEAIGTLIFSNLRIRRPEATTVFYRLQSSLKIIVEGMLTLKGDKGKLVPKFVFEELPEPAEIDKYVGTKLNILCSKNLSENAFSVEFSDNPPIRGFSLGTAIFEPKFAQVDDMKCIQLEMTKKYSSVGYQFCVSSNKDDCDEQDIQIAKPEELNTWINYTTGQTTVLEFTVYEEMRDENGNLIPYNFDQFTSPSLTIAFAGKNSTSPIKIAIDKNVLARKGSFISFNKVDATVEDGWNGNICTSIYVYQSKFNPGSAVMKVEGDGVNVISDYDSFEYVKTLIPDKLEIYGIDHKQLIMYENEVILGQSGTSKGEVKIQYKDEKPAINLQINGDFLIKKGDSTNKGLVPLYFSTFGQSSIIIDGNFQDSYSGIHISKFADGIVKAKHESIPLTTDGTSFEIDSEVNKLNITGDVGLNTDAKFKLTGENGTIVIKNGEFGKDTNIIAPNISNFIVSNATINGIVANKLEKLHVTNLLTVTKGSSIRIDDFTYDEGTTINVKFTPGNMPYVVADKITKSNVKPKEFIATIDTTQAVNQYLFDTAKNFMNKSLELFCGKNLDCDDWAMNFSYPKTLDKNPFILQCKNSFNDRKCVTIRTQESPSPIPTTTSSSSSSSKPDKSTTGNAKYIVAGVAGSVVLIVILVVVFLFIRRRKLSNDKVEQLLSSVEQVI